MAEKEKIAASELLSEHVRSSDHVLVIGPNNSPLCDPSAMFLSMHMHGGKGTLTLLDNKSPTLQAKLRQQIGRITRSGRSPPRNLIALGKKLDDTMFREQFEYENMAALGDPYQYAKEIRDWKTGGFQLKTPRVLISDARRIKKPDNSMDVVFEHGSMPWIRDVEGPLREYLRVVRPGGRVIIFTNDKTGKADHEHLRSLFSPFLGKTGSRPRGGICDQIAKVTEHAFYPAYSALGTFQRSHKAGTVNFEKLSPLALKMFV
ncbi:MAG: methyltransferase domain-containing protein, partial [Candidatus Micrarchaeota archaeon]